MVVDIIINYSISYLPYLVLIKSFERFTHESMFGFVVLVYFIQATRTDIWPRPGKPGPRPNKLGPRPGKPGVFFLPLELSIKYTLHLLVYLSLNLIEY